MTDPSNVPNLVLRDASGGRLAENIVHFARVLRRAGLPVGPAKIIDALEAVTVIDLSSRKEFYWALHSVFVNRRDQRDVFNQAFHVFWRNPDLLDKMLQMLLPSMKVEQEPQKEDLFKRVTEAMAGEKPPDSPPETEGEEIEFDATLTWSQSEILQTKDFEKMSAAELAQAREAIRRLRFDLSEFPTRRFKPARDGKTVDMPATLRAAARSPGGAIPLRFKKTKMIRPPLVVLCDISGSMDRYARMLLHFLHALSNDRDRVHVFLFGTRLTAVTRHLKQRDPDAAIDRVSAAVQDWAGGTRIGHCLHEFNRDWSRRVLGQGAEVLLITDGLDRDGAEGVEEQMERLHRSTRRLMWLNPLLRYDAYQPLTQGARAMIAHVDDFRPIHNLASLRDLAGALA